MTRRLPENHRLLHSAFDPKRIQDILPGEVFEIDGVEFVCAYLPDSTPERFYIVKSPDLVERYIELCSRFKDARIVELGIAEGGSTALMALVADPEKLLAVDLESERLEALDSFISSKDLHEVVRPFYGVDQADRARLAAIVDQEFAGPLDLVIDDCSHQLAATRSSFETLFPRLRHGGLYVIEDWNADHLMRDAVAAALRKRIEAGDESVKDALRGSFGKARDEERRAPLSQPAIEFVLARAGSGDVVEDVVVDEFWVTVRRGPGELDPDSFRLDDAYADHFGLADW